MADWSIARAELDRLFLRDLLAAETPHSPGAGGTAFDPGEGFAGSLLRPYLLRVCRAGAALRRGDGTAWPLCHHPVGDYLQRADPGGCARSSAQAKGAAFLPHRGNEMGRETGCRGVFPPGIRIE